MACKVDHSEVVEDTEATGEQVGPVDHEFMKELHHRVKNNLQVVCSLLRLESRRVADPDSRGVFKRSEERIQSMALVYDKLYRSDGYDTVPLHEYLQEMVKQLVGSVCNANNRPNLCFDLTPVFVSSRLATNLGLLINEVISNHLRTNVRQENGALLLSLLRDEAQVVIELREDGAAEATPSDTAGGMEQQILDALVKQVSGILTSNSEGGVATRVAFPVQMLES